MVKVKYEGEILEFKNFREAHRDLDCYRVCRYEGCTASRLEHYSDHEMTHDDFGNEIGKECVEDMFEVITDGAEIDAAEYRKG